MHNSSYFLGVWAHIQGRACEVAPGLHPGTRAARGLGLHPGLVGKVQVSARAQLDSPFSLSPLSAPSFSSTRVHGPLQMYLPFDATRTMELMKERGRFQDENKVEQGALGGGPSTVGLG